LNIPNEEASQNTNARETVAYVSIETDGFLPALQRVLLLPQMVLLGPSKVFPILVHVFDSATLKLRTQQVAGFVRETTSDGDILKLVVAQCGIAIPKRIDPVCHKLSLGQTARL
jgi:hypothetical protein